MWEMTGATWKLPGLPAGTDPLAFNRMMAEEHRVATIPGFAFGLSDVSRANYQRLSYGALDEATVHEGVQQAICFLRLADRAHGHRALGVDPQYLHGSRQASAPCATCGPPR